MKHEYLECECSSSEHIMRLSYDPDDKDYLYVETYLKPHGFFCRIWCAIKYIFGYRSKYGDFAEYMWNKETAKQLSDVCGKFVS